MRWTMYRAGVRMTDLRISMAVSGVDMVKALVMSHEPHGPRMSERSLVGVLRDELGARGVSNLVWFGDWLRDCDSKDAQERWQWARAEVVRHWPQLDDDIPKEATQA